MHQGEFTSWSWQDECIRIVAKGVHGCFYLDLQRL